MRMTGELGYGLPAFGGRAVLTPYTGILLSGRATKEFRAGARLRMASSLDLALQGTRRERTGAAVEHGLALRPPSLVDPRHREAQTMHDIGDDHDHDGDTPEDEEDHPLWKLDTITLTSVGIDVGTATSQILFSRLVLRRLGRELSSRFVVTERKTLYLSPIRFTPYTANRKRIDDEALGRLVDDAYDEAGLTPDDVNTGAIILTGEAIRRDNARAIADLFADQRGDFVCATAGHNFEALLAAHGSGAVAFSAEQKCRVLNIESAAAPPS